MKQNIILMKKHIIASILIVILVALSTIVYYSIRLDLFTDGNDLARGPARVNVPVANVSINIPAGHLYAIYDEGNNAGSSSKPGVHISTASGSGNPCVYYVIPVQNLHNKKTVWFENTEELEAKLAGVAARGMSVYVDAPRRKNGKLGPTICIDLNHNVAIIEIGECADGDNLPGFVHRLFE